MQILNWKEFNPRGDVKNSRWFRLDHDMLEADQFYGFSHGEIVAWFYILCRASKENSGTVLIDFDRAARVRKLKKGEIQSALKKLQELQIVHVDVTPTLRARDGDVTGAGPTERNGTERDGTEPLDFDFEAIYKKYPRKMGKTAGMKTCRREITNPEEYAKLKLSVERCAKHHADQGTEKQYIPYFSTFMSGWEDSLDADYGTSVTTPSGPLVTKRPKVRFEEVSPGMYAHAADDDGGEDL